MVLKYTYKLICQIDNLFKRSMVARAEDEIDRRNKLIFLTKKGKLLQKQLYPLVPKMYEKATSKVDAADIEKAILLVKKMNGNLKK